MRATQPSRTLFQRAGRRNSVRPAGEAGEDGTWTLQLVLDQGAWEEVLTISGEDADNLQDLLSTAKVVHFDVSRRVLLFGTTAVGSF